MAKAIAAQTRQKLDMNQQCLSEGLANFTGSFFQCMPGSGSLTRSAINQQAGAVSQWSGVVSAAAVALIMVAFAPYARLIPRSALAGILIVSAWKMIDWRGLLYHLRVTRFDSVIVVGDSDLGGRDFDRVLRPDRRGDVVIADGTARRSHAAHRVHHHA